MEEHTCCKEAEIAEIQARQEDYREINNEHYESLKSGIDSVLIMLRGDGNGNRGLIPRVIKIEDTLERMLDNPTAKQEDKQSDCLYFKAGKLNMKIPISKGTLKVIGCGLLLLLMFTGQINVNSPLVTDIIKLIAKLGG